LQRRALNLESTPVAASALARPALRASVRSLILLGFGSLLVTLVAVVAGSAWLSREHKDTLDRVQRREIASSALREVHIDGVSQFSTLLYYVATGDEALIPVIEDYGAQTQGAFLKARAIIQAEGDPDEVAALDELATDSIFLPRAVSNILMLRQKGDIAGANAALDDVRPRLLDIQERFTTFADDQSAIAGALTDDAKQTADTAFWLLIASGAAGGVLVLAVSTVVARTILGPLSRLAAAARSVTEGELEARAPTVGPVEFAALGTAFNGMTETLLDRNYELREANEELQDRNRELLDARAQAATDGLTGLPNHRAFQERIRQEFQLSDRKGSSLSLIMLDIDRFKQVNDSHGHVAGDEVLREVANALGHLNTGNDAYRYGGDEFAIVLPDADQGRAMRVAERVRRGFEEWKDMRGGQLTVSLGVASFPGAARTVEELIYGADSAMYWAKSAGKNKVGRWSKEQRKAAAGFIAWPAADIAGGAPDAVAALASALAAKDPMTSEHTARCSAYAEELARELGLNEGERNVVRTAALLHDIGKLGIPDQILFKADKLTPEEWSEMQRHPSLGSEILSNVRAIADVTPAVLHHHEHFDGSGYPHGLAGDAIPLASRILLVTDAFDAMTTNRPYRKAMPLRTAIDELERYSGTQFDPEIVSAFLRVVARQQPAGSSRPTRSLAVPRGTANNRTSVEKPDAADAAVDGDTVPTGRSK